jgi:hypothetical protein
MHFTPKNPRRLRLKRTPALTVAKILTWADAHHARTGHWPRCTDGRLTPSSNEKWRNIDQLLRQGGRGLPGGDSLPQLLERERQVRNLGALPGFTVEEVCSWVRLHHEQTGRWPHVDAGAITDAPGETWESVERALREGRRGFPGGDTLAHFVARHFGVRN